MYNITEENKNASQQNLMYKCGELNTCLKIYNICKSNE